MIAQIDLTMRQYLKALPSTKQSKFQLQGKMIRLVKSNTQCSKSGRGEGGGERGDVETKKLKCDGMSTW